jgi:hypothetical protein
MIILNHLELINSLKKKIFNRILEMIHFSFLSIFMENVQLKYYYRYIIVHIKVSHNIFQNHNKETSFLPSFLMCSYCGTPLKWVYIVMTK